MYKRQVLTLIQNHVIHLVNVGDSRAYLLTRENVTQITRDHSIVQEMLESGEITEEQARNCLLYTSRCV